MAQPTKAQRKDETTTPPGCSAGSDLGFSNWRTGTVQLLDHFSNLLVMPKLMITNEGNRSGAVDLA